MLTFSKWVVWPRMRSFCRPLGNGLIDLRSWLLLKCLGNTFDVDGKFGIYFLGRIQHGLWER